MNSNNTPQQNDIITFFNTNLDTIAKIQDGHKLFLNSDNTINLDEPYMFQGIWRYCNNVSRKDALHILTKLYNDIELYFNALYVKTLDNKSNSCYPYNQPVSFNEHDFKAFKTIIPKLEESSKGIVNLKLTYATDINTCNELDTIIEKIKSLCNNFTKMIQ